MNGIRRALVTGAAGFVGRSLCALLRSEGAIVRGVDRVDAAGPWDELRVADLAADGALDGVCDDVDTVFHLAALTHAATRGADLTAFRRANVEVTRKVVDAATAAGVERFVLLSSVKVLGEGGPATGSEADPPRPTTPYGITKHEAEQLLLSPGATAPPHAAVIRAPLIYGPGVGGNLGLLLARAARGRLPALPDTGNRRSLVDVRDVAAALLLAARHPAAAGRVYIVTDGRSYSTADILAAMRRAYGGRRPRRTWPAWLFAGAARAGDLLVRLGLPAPYDSEMHQKLLGSAHYSSAAIAAELGYRPRYDLERALPDMVRG